MKRHVLGAAILFVGCSATGPIHVSASPVVMCGQEKAELVVVVEDEAGAKIPGARVSLDRKRGLAASADTDTYGRVSFQALSALDSFGVRAELQGFYVSQTSTFNLQPGCRTTVKVPLRVNLVNADCILQVQAVSER